MNRQRSAIDIALLVGGAALTTGSFVLAALDDTRADRGLTLTTHVLCVALPVGLGLFVLSRRRDDRFARLLIGIGLWWSIVTLAESHHPLQYSIGRTSAWVGEVAIVYLLLAFPTGRLTTRAERRLFGGTALVAAVLYLPSALLAEFPHPSPFSSCVTSCPHNALLLGDGLASFMDDVVRPVREMITAVLFSGVGWVLVRRAWRGPPLARRVVAPAAAVAILRASSLASYDALRLAGETAGALRVIAVAYELSLALVTLGFAAGLLVRRLFVADSLERLTSRLRPHASATDLRAALAEALQDPTLQVVYWAAGNPGRWANENGWPVPAPGPDGTHVVTEVAAGGRRIAAIVHDASLAQDPALVQAAASYALTALENERLVAQLSSSLAELSRSRARIMVVGDRARRKIERDLHDGAQQRLVALRVRLELVAERLEAGSPESARAVRDLEGEVEDTIDEVRSFARGIYPPLLAERGLSEALRAAGRSAPLPTIVDAARLGRYAPEIEATVYFACMEALQNTSKHATGASGVTISVSSDPHLHFEVSDDGVGFDPAAVEEGAGITNMRDRLESVGGKLTVESAPGGGTRVRGVIPVAED